MKKGKIVKKKKRPFQRPRFMPTAFQRHQVKKMVGFGFKQDAIAELILNSSTHKPISAKTLREKFPREIQTGKTAMLTNVANALYTKALGHGTQSVTAAIFIMKTQGGWRDKIDVVHDLPLTDGFAERLAKLINLKHGRHAAK
jgi:hypothetical protein